eukprot:m.203064 g.203064  ORF g.203064 m.203064 type:complete len:1055 (+) comp15756_c0_seq2:141-3305(+)
MATPRKATSSESSTFVAVPKKRSTAPIPTKVEREQQLTKLLGSHYSELVDDLEGHEDCEPTRGKFQVLKFGGSSQKSPEQLRSVLGVIEEAARSRHAEGKRVGVILSAPGNTTDLLIEATRKAAEGNIESAELHVDIIADLATTNFVTCAGMDGSFRGIPAFASLLREFLEPLRQILLGVSLLREQTPAALDLILSFGERLSVLIVTFLLQRRDINAVAVDARSWLRTDSCFGAADVVWPVAKKRARLLLSIFDEQSDEKDMEVIIMNGFTGQTEDGRTTTLGRNGSDFAAALLGAAILAQEVVINTDVRGVYTADPDLCETAYPVARLTYHEAIELSSFGTGLFHSRTFLPLIEADVPMHIRNTMHAEDVGTIISGTKPSPQQQVKMPTCVTSLTDLAMVSLQSRLQSDSQELSSSFFSALEGIDTFHGQVSAHGQCVSVCVRIKDLEVTTAALEEQFKGLIQKRNSVESVAAHEKGDPSTSLKRLSMQMDVVAPVSIVALVQNDICSMPGTASKFFSSLGNIRVLGVGDGMYNSMYCIIPGDDTRKAVNSVHSNFNFASRDVHILLIATSAAKVSKNNWDRGTALSVIRKLTNLGDKIKSQGVRMHLLGVCMGDQRLVANAILDHHDTVKDQTPSMNKPQLSIEFQEGESLLEGKTGMARVSTGTGGPIKNLLSSGILSRMGVLTCPIVVDCSASMDDSTEQMYNECMQRGISVVVSNARSLYQLNPTDFKGFSRSWSSVPWFCMDSAVGASLPVLEQLRSIERSGDRVVKVEVTMSGTLSFVYNNLCSFEDKTNLFQSIMGAYDNGYMEQDPFDDLMGEDVVRKLVVLSRVLHLNIEKEDIRVSAPLIDLKILAKARQHYHELLKQTTSEEVKDQHRDCFVKALTTVFDEYKLNENFSKILKEVKAARRRLHFVAVFNCTQDSGIKSQEAVEASKAGCSRPSSPRSMPVNVSELGQSNERSIALDMNNGGSVVDTDTKGEPWQPCIELALQAVNSKHPCYRLRGFEIMAEFTSKHHPAECPLIIQGAGTGGDLGSACLINDIVKVMTSRYV